MQTYCLSIKKKKNYVMIAKKVFFPLLTPTDLSVSGPCDMVNLFMVNWHVGCSNLWVVCYFSNWTLLLMSSTF